MADGITGVTPRQVSNTVNEAATFAKGLGLSEKATQAVKDVAAILSSRSVNVTASTGRTDGVGTADGATGTPALDSPADPKQVEANLEKLLAYLQLDNEERQAEMAKERIETQKDSLAAEHKERKAKIDETLKKMDQAAKSRLANRIFGWLGAIVAVAAAVAATVFAVLSGGAGAVAAGFAIAGAVVAVTSLVLNETGAMDKLTEMLASALEKSMSSKNAKIAAALIINLSIMAISLGCSVGGMVAGIAQAGKALVDTVATVAKTVSSITAIAGTAVGAGSLTAGAVSTGLGYKAEMSQADLSELEKIMAELQRRLEESEEELNAILEAIQNGLGQIAAILASATDTQTEIASQIGQMA